MDKSNPNCGCGEEAVCNEAELQCDPCCRCIPQRLCATFEAYGCDCDGNTAFLPLVGISEYQGDLFCDLETMDLTVLLHFENKICYWRVISEIFYIDELFEIGPEKQSCEKPELELEVSFVKCSGTLRIKRHELVILPPYIEGECNELPFCDDCECTCDCLCVAVIGPYGSTEDFGEICNTSYPNDPPVWEGTVGEFELSLALGRDGYGQCVIVPTVDGAERDPVLAPGCGDMSATIILSETRTIEVWCKRCDCVAPCTCCDCLTSLTVTAHLSECCGHADVTEEIPATRYIGPGECLAYGRGSRIFSISCDGLSGYARVDWDLFCFGGTRYLQLTLVLLSTPAPVEYAATAKSLIRIDNCKSDLTVVRQPATSCVEVRDDFTCVCAGVEFSAIPTFLLGCQ